MDRLEAVEQRLAALEALMASGQDRAPASTRPEQTEQAGQTEASDAETFWALNGLTARMPAPGAVMIVGDVRLPDGGIAQWQEAAATADLMDGDWEHAADALAALGSPIRLRILQEILRGSSTARELAELQGMGTTGQIYHHLRQLVAAGWLQGRAGGRHEIPAKRVIPLLTTIVGGLR